ncbi:hypothetical protein ACOME3_002642 [Neoechinorhynchus agilis]
MSDILNVENGEIVLHGCEFKISPKLKSIEFPLVGNGLRRLSTDTFKSLICGRVIFEYNKNGHVNGVHLNTLPKLYTPVPRDYVVGVIANRSSEVYKVSINACEYALLPRLSFERATHRNKPELSPGDLVFCRVRKSAESGPAELTCVERDGTANGMGPLHEHGILIRMSPMSALSLIKQDARSLFLLAKEIKYEIIVGFNGYIYVSAEDEETIIAIVRWMKKQFPDCETHEDFR